MCNPRNLLKDAGIAAGAYFLAPEVLAGLGGDAAAAPAIAGAAGGAADIGLANSISDVASTNALSSAAFADAGAPAIATGVADAVPAAGAAGLGDYPIMSDTLGAAFLPVTGAGPGVSSLAPEVASSLGVAPPSTNFFAPGGPGAALNVAGADVGGSLPDWLTGAAGGAADWLANAAGNAGNWISNNPATAGLLGIAAMNATKTPQLPDAAKTLLGTSTQSAQTAQATVASGGTNSPAWPGMKASIDQQIDQQLRDAQAQMQQAAANSGMGGASSGVVQQQMYALTQKAETQRQALYSQALQQIVSEAVTMLTGGNQALGSIANMQMSQSDASRQSAAQTAELALLLMSQQKHP